MGKRRVPVPSAGGQSQPANQPPAEGAGDVALVLDRTPDAEGYRVLRHRADNQVELGTMRPLKEGRPIDGEVISLQPRQDMPFLYDVKTELPDPRAAHKASDRAQPPARLERRPTTDGPAQIATEQYRSGWEAIWGAPDPEKLN